MKKDIKLNENDSNTFVGCMTILFAVAVIIFGIFVLSGCSVFETGYKLAKDNIEIKIKGQEDPDAVIIDSVVVKFEPVYWEENIEIDSTELGDVKTEFKMNGYSIWILETDKTRYNEVIKHDTVIYFIRK